jgi:hypothetical protein
MDRYHRTVRVPVEAHGGTVVQLLGDGVMCAFGVPQVREGDAIRAVRAAVGIQRAFRAFADEERDAAQSLGLRVALWDLENLSIMEVDAGGRIVAIIGFDPGDRRGAAMEMLFDQFTMADHRRTGLGRLEREAYLASLAALFAGAPDVTTEILRVIAVEQHGMLVLARNFGTLRQGGASESVYLRIMWYRDDRTGGAEMFEPEDIDAARTRFEELRPTCARGSPA